VAWEALEAAELPSSGGAFPMTADVSPIMNSSYSSSLFERRMSFLSF